MPSLSHAPASAGMLAQILPPVMFGSLTAILLAGMLNLAGKRWPSLTGNGALSIGEVGRTDGRRRPAGSIRPPPRASPPPA